jgi:hypothetical protein
VQVLARRARKETRERQARGANPDTLDDLEEFRLSAQYRVDSERRVIFSSASGVITDEDLRKHQTELRADPAFDRSFDQLWDFTAVDEVEVSPDALRRLARARSYSATAKRAVVTPDDLGFGLGRMFQMLHDEAPEEVQIFRTLADARRWLGLDDD